MENFELFDPKNPADLERIHSLMNHSNVRLVDTYDEQIKELAEIHNPAVSEGREVGADPGERMAYYPWRNTLVRIVGEEAYKELRTNRNKNLLTAEEQERFAHTCVGFAGLNVGNPGALAIALEGGAREMKLADLDPLSLTNLNRFRAGLPDLGVNKAVLTARQILEIDPYYKLDLHEAGIRQDTLASFIAEPKINVLVEEMDALPLKIAIRNAARDSRVPVVMVTGNGEGVLLDVERYDLEPDLPILSGFLDESVRIKSLDPVTAKLSSREKAHLARDFMGSRFLDRRLLDSFEEYGKTLAGIPQLAESSFLRGAALCFAVKAIVLDRPLASGRYSFSFAEHLKLLT